MKSTILHLTNELVKSLNDHVEKILTSKAERKSQSLKEYKKSNKINYCIQMEQECLKVWYHVNKMKSLVMIIDQKGNMYKPAERNDLSFEMVKNNSVGKIENWENLISYFPESTMVCLN